MNASYTWLRDFVDVTMSPASLRDLLTSRAATVDEMIALRTDLEDILVARVVECEPHPDSDHLKLTKVDIGTGELLDVVCGAPNVAAGALYPFAPVGTTLPGGLKIEKRKIRGHTSNGMLCSARELGLSDEHVGIMMLNVFVYPGTPFLEAMPTGDVRFVLDVGANRADMLSHEGVAREIAAATYRPMRDPLAELLRVDEAPAGQESDQPALAAYTGAPNRRREPKSLFAETGTMPSVVDASANASADDASIGGAPAGEALASPVGDAGNVWGAAGTMADRMADRVDPGVAPKISVRVESPDDCPRYCAVTIRGVTVGPSPDWLRERLEGAGVRSINNVVDATNYMLHGFGQPMHAFDARKLTGDAIVVRRAFPGEKLRTLDGVERALTEDMLVIADAERAHAVAGIMGGADSEIDETSTDIVLEVAVFDPRSVRRTRRALGVSTDASYRFERAMDSDRVQAFAQRAGTLITALAGGEVTDVSMVVSALHARRTSIRLRCARIERVLGQWVSADECARLLRGVGFETVERSGTAPDGKRDDVLDVTAPTWRADVTAEVDLIEEIARLRGYDQFADELRPFRVGTVPDAPSYVVAKRVTEALVAAGLYEVRPIPFVADAGEQGVRIVNPLAENEGMLRSAVLPTLARRVEHNFAHMVHDVRLFEVGVAFTRGPDKVPVERTIAAAVLTGNRHPGHFTEAKPAQVDLWDVKAIAEVIGDSAFGRGRMSLVPRAEGDGWNAVVGDVSVGYVGALTDVDAPVWASPVYGVEIDITTAFDAVPEPARYVPLPTTPAAEFDLALLVPDTVVAADVERVIRGAAGELLESVEPFDEFRGSGVADGARSVAWRLTFRHPERTLRDKEIEGRRDKILRTLDQELGVRPRLS